MAYTVDIGAPRASNWGLAQRLGLAIVAVTLADWLFFNSHAIGVSLPLFALTCIALVIATNPMRADTRLRLVSGVMLLLALAALGENISWLSVLVASATMLYFARVLVVGRLNDWPSQLPRAIGLPFQGPFRLVADLARARGRTHRERAQAFRLSSFSVWIVPVLLSLLFLALFASANPVLDEWLSALDPRVLLAIISPTRMVFWLGLAGLIWPFMRMKVSREPKNAPAASEPVVVAGGFALLGAPSVLRSLILFNLLFALQTGLDAAYLWGGLALPHGMTYASYAHRGAYPLIATALLAAAFVLVAMRAGGASATRHWIKWLVLVFVAQNVMLVASSIYRTTLYMDAYGLTELRLAALIWMGLVGIGLLLIVVQILGRKGAAWLLNANAVALAATLYLCCFANFPYIVARYNVTHWLERDGMGPALDVRYLLSLGPQVLPALDALESASGAAAIGSRSAGALRQLRHGAQLQLEGENWRSLTFRGWRLKRYLETHPGPSAAEPGFPPPGLN